MMKTLEIAMLVLGMFFAVVGCDSTNKASTVRAQQGGPHRDTSGVHSVSDPQRQFVDKVHKYVARNNRTLALDECDKAIAADPDNCEAYVERGRLQNGAYRGNYGLHDYYTNQDAAIADLTKAISLRPYAALIYAYRAWAYTCHKKDWNAAVVDLTKAISLWPQHPQFYGERAFCLMQRGVFPDDFQQAMVDFRKEASLDPKLGASSEVYVKEIQARLRTQSHDAVH